MPSSETNSKQGSKPDVVKEEKKTQTSSVQSINAVSNKKLLLLYVVLTVMDWRENKSSVTNTLLSKTRLTKCIERA